MARGQKKGGGGKKKKDRLKSRYPGKNGKWGEHLRRLCKGFCARKKDGDEERHLQERGHPRCGRKAAGLKKWQERNSLCSLAMLGAETAGWGLDHSGGPRGRKKKHEEWP